MAEPKSGQIVNVMKERRLFPPPKEFAAKARIGSIEQYEKLWNEAATDIEGFWGKMGHELHWFKPYGKVLDWNEPAIKLYQKLGAAAMSDWTAQRLCGDALLRLAGK